VITVFYDGKCGLCSKEINHYRKIASEGVFDWQDITASEDQIKQEGVDLAQGLKLLHAKDNEGKLHVGIDAFILIWKQIRRWRILAVFINLPMIRPIANRLYRAFANWRFNRLEHCQLAVKNDSRD